jgi:hypothetical protein
MAARGSRSLLLLTWLPPMLAVGITLWATSSVPSEGGPIPTGTSTIVGRALLGGSVLCLLGAVLGLRTAAVVRRSGQGAAIWPFVIAVPLGLMMIAIWKLFFAAS